MAQNTGYQQSTYAAKFDPIHGHPLDKDGILCTITGNKQAILLLEGQANPDSDKYEVIRRFKEGDVLDGHPTMIYNTDACPVIVTEPEPELPEYNKASLSQIYIEIDVNDPLVNGEGYNILGKDWDTGLPSDFSNGGFNRGTYKTRRIGEYEWMVENWKMRYHPDRAYKNYMLTQEILDSSLILLSLADSETKNGCYSFAGKVTDKYFAGLRFYNSSHKETQLNGWCVPSKDDFTQLFGMIGQDLSQDNIMKNLFVSPDDTEIPWLSSWVNSDKCKDTLGARFVPCGHKLNNNLANNGKIFQFGERLAFGLYGNPSTAEEAAPTLYINTAAGEKVGTVVFDNSSNIPNDGSIKFWQRNYRFCRPLSDSELGYKLYKDEANDKIIVTTLNDTPPANTSELPKGLLRGLAVRWMNPEKTEVLALLSKLQAEVDKTQNNGGYGWYGW